MTDHERIYLQPECCADQSVGRIWCEHDAPENCDDGKPWVEYVRKGISRRDTLLEVAELLRNELWKGEPSGNPLKGWVSTSTGQRFTSLGSRIMFGKFLTQHNNQIDILISKLERMAGE